MFSKPGTLVLPDNNIEPVAGIKGAVVPKPSSAWVLTWLLKAAVVNQAVGSKAGVELLDLVNGPTTTVFLIFKLPLVAYSSTLLPSNTMPLGKPVITEL